MNNSARVVCRPISGHNFSGRNFLLSLEGCKETLSIGAHTTNYDRERIKMIQSEIYERVNVSILKLYAKIMTIFRKKLIIYNLFDLSDQRVRN